MFPMINMWCAFYSIISTIIMNPGFDHCDFLKVDVGSSSAKSHSVVWFVLWVFRNSFAVGSEILH